MSKSKAVVVEKISFNPVVTDCLNGIIENLYTIYQNSVNPVSAVYIIGAFVRVFAQQKSYLDNLRDQADEAVKAKDLYQIKNITFKLNNALDNKGFDDCWTSIAEMYDSIITQTIDGMTSDALVNSFKTSEDILRDCQAFYDNQKSASIDDAIKTLMAMRNL